MVSRYILPLRLLPTVRTEMTRRPVAHLGCIVGVRLDDPRRPLTSVELSAVLSQTPDGLAMDEASAKPRAELLVAGSAMAPEGRSVGGIDVTVRLGSIRKTVRVWGDRYWHYRPAAGGWVPTDPAPFAEMELSWTRAYGGPRVAQNPIGVGDTTMDLLGAGQLAPLPNIEDPEQPVVEPGRAYSPVHLGAIQPAWQPRSQRMGTQYDQRWREEEWPAFARDFDVLYHNVAQQDQWAPDYFRGDEVYEIHNMRADAPVQRGALPGLRARCFMAHHGGPDASPAEDRLEECPLRLDTVWLLGTQGIAVMFYRAKIAVPDSDLAHLRAVMCGLEWLTDTPRPVSHYEEVYRLRMDPEDGHLHATNDAQLMPVLNAAEQADVAAERAKAKAERIAEMKARKAALVERMRVLNARLREPLEAAFAQTRESRNKLDAAVAAAGFDALPAQISHDALLNAARDIPSGAEMLFSPEMAAIEDAIAALPVPTAQDAARMNIDGAALKAGFAKVSAAIDAAQASMETKAAAKAIPLPATEGVSRDPLATLRAAVANEMPDALAGLDKLDEEVAAARAASIGQTRSPQDDEAVHRRWVEARVRGMSSRPAPTPTLEELGRGGLPRPAAPTVPDLEARLRDSGLTGIDPKPPTMAELEARHEAVAAFGEALIADMAGDEGESPVGPLLSPVRPYLGELVERAAREGWDLTGRDLSEGDYRGRELSGVDFSGADLTDADFSGARLADAKFDGAVLTRARFDGADLTRARIHGARLHENSFAGARLAGADLAELVFDKVDFTAADGTGADWSGITLSGINVVEGSLAGCDLTGARIHNTAFFRTAFDAARLAGGTLNATTFAECEGPRIDLGHVAAETLTVTLCTMPLARLEGARLEDCNIVQTDLSDSDARNLVVANTTFLTNVADRMDLSGSRFDKFAALAQCSLREAKLEGVEAHQSSFRTADLTGAVFRRSRLRELDLGEADLTGATLDYCALQRAILASAIMRGASLRGSSLMEVLMRKADCRDADFTGALLYAAQPMEADLTGAIFDGADMTNFDRWVAARPRRRA